MQFVRLFTGNDGRTHFQDIDLLFDRTDAIKPIRLAKTTGAVSICRFSPDHPVSWHPAPQLQYVVMLAGQMEVEAGDGERRRFSVGDVLFTEDTVGKGHVTRTVGDEPRVLLNVPLKA